VPSVSIGGQESQLFPTRGTDLAKRLGLKRFRVDILPISIGFPFRQWAIGISGLASGMMLALLLR